MCAKPSADQSADEDPEPDAERKPDAKSESNSTRNYAGNPDAANSADGHAHKRTDAGRSTTSEPAAEHGAGTFRLELDGKVMV